MGDQTPPGVEIETNMGVFTVELYWQHAPKTCRCGAPRALSPLVAVVPDRRRSDRRSRRCVA